MLGYSLMTLGNFLVTFDNLKHVVNSNFSSGHSTTLGHIWITSGNLRLSSEHLGWFEITSKFHQNYILWQWVKRQSWTKIQWFFGLLRLISISGKTQPFVVQLLLWFFSDATQIHRNFSTFSSQFFTKLHPRSNKVLHEYLSNCSDSYACFK